jgi:hypothetical protein
MRSGRRSVSRFQPRARARRRGSRLTAQPDGGRSEAFPRSRVSLSLPWRCRAGDGRGRPSRLGSYSQLAGAKRQWISAGSAAGGLPNVSAETPQPASEFHPGQARVGPALNSPLCSGGLRRTAEPRGSWQLEGRFSLLYVRSRSVAGEAGGAPLVADSASVVVSQAVLVSLCRARGAVGVAGGRAAWLPPPRRAIWPGGRGAGCARPPSTRRTAVAANAGNSPNSSPPGEAARVNDAFRRFHAQACV